MAAPNNNNVPQHQYFTTQAHNAYQPHPQVQHSTSIYTPQQLYPYMSVFYQNVQHQQQPNQSPIPDPHPDHNNTINNNNDWNYIPTAPLLNKYWSDRNDLQNNNQYQYYQYNQYNQQNEYQNNNNNDNSFVNDDDDDDNDGYWNIPQPEYGLLAHNKTKKSILKQPRIGDKYQANIPQLIPDNNNNNNDNIQLQNNDQCVWETGIVNPNQLDQYLKVVQFVMGTSSKLTYTDCHYDEEKALYLLKLHNYNIIDTLHTLKLQKPDKNNTNFAFLFANNDDIDLEQDTDIDEHLYQYSGNMSILNNNNNNNHGNNGNMDCDNDNDSDYDDEDYCFTCGDGGSLLICDIASCHRVWHIHCAQLTSMPLEDTWYCPSHTCSICKQQSSFKYMCSYCCQAYCLNHCPKECQKYKYFDIEFLCLTCLSERIQLSNNDNNDNSDYGFASDRFISRLMELHKRRRNHLNKINGRKNNNNNHNIIPSHCKIGRSEIEWFDLYCGVIKIGGLYKMDSLSIWDNVRKYVDLNKNFESENVWRTLRDSYIEYLYVYEYQYYPLTNNDLPRVLQSIVDSKGCLDGLVNIDYDDDDDDNVIEETDDDDDDDDDDEQELTPDNDNDQIMIE